MTICIRDAVLCLLIAAPHLHATAGEEYPDDFNFELDTVITPTRTKLAIVDSPVSVTKLDAKKVFYLGLKEFEDIFRLVPGFIVASYQGHSPQISYHGTQGSVPRRMDALFDGSSIYRSGYARVNWGRLPIGEQDLNYIEIARGPSVSDYGSNSFLSAVNLISQKPESNQINTFEFTDGAHDTENIFLRTGFESEGVYSTLRFSNETNSGFDLDALDGPVDDGKRVSSLFWHRSNDDGYSSFETKAIVAQSDYDINIISSNVFDKAIDSSELNVFLGSKYIKPIERPGYDGSFEFSVNLSKYKLDQEFDRCLPGGLFLDELRAVDESPNIDLAIMLRQLLAGGDLVFDPSKLEIPDYLALAKLALRVASEGSNIINPICGVTNQNVDETTLVIESVVKTASLDHWYNTFVVGFRINHIESETYLGGSVNSNTAKLSNHFRYHPNEYFTINAGFMLEGNELNDFEFSPRTSVTYKPVQNHAFRIGAAQAKRSPDIYETSRDWSETYKFYGGYTDLDGRKESSLFKTALSNDSLEAETITEFDIGYYAKLIDYSISYDFKIYQSKLTDLISEPFLLYDFNQTNDGELELNGFEMQSEYSNSPVIFGVSYSYIDSDTEQAEEETLYARHSGSIYGIYEFARNYHVALGHYSNSELATTSYDRTDLTLTKEIFMESNSRIILQANVRYSTSTLSHYTESDAGFTSERKYEDDVSLSFTGALHF